jgi:hypothetical protein
MANKQDKFNHDIQRAIDESLKKVEEQGDSDLLKATENSLTSAEIDIIEREQLELVKKMSVGNVKEKELNVGFSVSGLLATHYTTTIIINESTTMDEIIEKSLLKLYEYVKKIEKESGIYCLRENYENLFKKDEIKLHCHDYNSDGVIWLCYHPEECEKEEKKHELDIKKKSIIEEKKQKIEQLESVVSHLTSYLEEQQSKLSEVTIKLEKISELLQGGLPLTAREKLDKISFLIDNK